jgi:hypothetical protein
MINSTPQPDYHSLGYVNIKGRWMHPMPSYPPPEIPDEQTQDLLTKEKLIPPIPNYLPPPIPPISRASDTIYDETELHIEKMYHPFYSNPLDGCEVISLLPFQGKLKNYSHVSNNITFEFDDFMCNCVIKVEKGSIDYIIIVHINPERSDNDPDHHHLKITFHGEYKCYHMQFASIENSSLYIGTIIDNRRSEWLCRVPKGFQSQKYKKLFTKLINIYRPAYPIVWGPFMIIYDVDKYLTI